jgi:hypothetical protein
MKKAFVILGALLLALIIGCQDPGVSTQRLGGTENTLPEELKGLKVYDVSTGQGGWISVAIMDNQVVSNTYKSGKATRSVILVQNNNSRTIEFESVISENDSIIVIKKVK